MTRIANAEANRAIGELAEMERAAQKEIARLMAKLASKKLGDPTESDKLHLANAQVVARQVRAVMTELKGKVLSKARAKALEVALKEHARLTGDDTFSPSAKRFIERVVDDRFKEITETFNDNADDIARAIRIGSVVPGGYDRMSAAVAERVGVSFSQATAATDSAIMASGRATVFADANEAASDTGADIVFRYVGPLDSKTRPFCLDHLTEVTRQVYTAKYLEQSDNGSGQPKPVAAYLGGYNCRHSLAPMPRARALKEGLIVQG
jgi:hypothetical protein